MLKVLAEGGLSFQLLVNIINFAGRENITSKRGFDSLFTDKNMVDCNKGEQRLLETSSK